MMQQVVMLSALDPNGSETRAMLLRQELAARDERDRINQERQERAKVSAPAPPTLAEVAASFAGFMKARAKSSRRLADKVNHAGQVDEEVYDPSPREVRRASTSKPVAAPVPPRSPPWRRPPSQPPERSWLERLFSSPRQSSKPVWK